MHNKSYRFSFLVIWCILLSISIVIMVTVITKQSNQMETSIGNNGTGDDARATHEQFTDPRQISVDYIQLVWGNQKSPSQLWTHSSLCFCENTSLLLQNDSVKITTGGFYHTYAQVTFISNNEQEGTVTLVANENVPGKTPRKLSEAENGNGIVSMSGVFRLSKGDSVKLNISPASKILREASKTYWGLFLLAKQEDK